MDYVYKPWGVAGILKNIADNKVKEAVEWLMGSFFPETAEEYLSILEDGDGTTFTASQSKMSQIKVELRDGLERATAKVDEQFEAEQRQMNMLCAVMIVCLLSLCCLGPCILRYRRQEQKAVLEANVTTVTPTTSHI